jgi:hypothetical protein
VCGCVIELDLPYRKEAAVAEDVKRSPRILAISWGRMEVEGLPVGKDLKLYPGGGREWDWSETGTRRSPGIQLEDLEEFLEQGATTIVLSRGMELRLQVGPRTLKPVPQIRLLHHLSGYVTTDSECRWVC